MGEEVRELPCLFTITVLWKRVQARFEEEEEEEVSWTAVWSGDGTPFGDVRDRSVSYLNLSDILCNGKNKVCDSVRKFGRPRQQISEILNFDDLHKQAKCYDRYHFGQCLVLPKISVLPPKGDKSCKSCMSRRFRQAENNPGKMHPSLPRRLTTAQDIYEFENRMYRWSENLSEAHSVRRCSRKSSVAGSRKELCEFFTDDLEDVEAQVSRYRSEIQRSPEPRDECSYRDSNMEKRERRRGNDEPTSEGNWRLRAMREAEASTMGDRNQREEPERTAEDAWEVPSMGARWSAVNGTLKRELQRSKSTPDMVGGLGRRNLQVWTGNARETHVEAETPRRNGSLMNVCSRTWAVYNDQQEADSLNAPQSLREPVSSPEVPGPGKASRFASGKNFFGHFLASRGATPTDMFSNTEPFSQFWVTLSNIYGQALVIIMLAFTLTEVMDNSVKLLSLQGIYLMFLYVGSIAVIICIYIWVLIDSCSSIQNDSAGLMSRAMPAGAVHDREPENMVTTKFGSLKKAHISRDRTSNTSFYLRIGAIAFGLGTLVFNGLEMAMHSMMEGSCLNDVVFVHPILHGLFTFLQMHFLFVNSQVLVERFGLAARFGFMHLAATNLALWIRLVIWESGNEWTHYLYLSHNGPALANDIPTPLHLRGFPKFITRRERDLGGLSTVSGEHMTQVVSLHRCLNTNSLGQLWTSSMPFLYPFIIQFSIIAAAVTYIMGQNVAKDHLFFQKQKKIGGSSKNCGLGTLNNGINTWGVDCGGASKGLFLGILCLVTGVVVIIIFLVVKENEDFPPDTIFWLTNGTLITILSITIVMSVVGLIQVRKLSVIGNKMPPLDKILAIASILGVQLYTISGMVVGAAGVAVESDQEFATPMQKRHGMLLAVSLIQLIQAIMQSCFVVEGIRRTSLSRIQVLTKPARQVVTFFMFSNAVLWAFDTFVIQSWMTQELQLRFFGVLAWGVISRVSLPLFIFFRFHSCVLLLEIWKKSYQSIHIDPGN